MTPRVRSLWFGIASTTCALGLGALAYRTARLELPAAVRGGIARRLGVPRSAVSLRDVHIGREGLVIEDLATGQLGARRVVYRPSLAALFGATGQGRLEIDTLVLEDPTLVVPTGLVDRVLVDRAEVEITRLGLRARARGVRVELIASSDAGLPGVSLDDVGLELARSEGALSLHRAAFTGLALGPITGLAGSLRRREDALELRAAGDGALLTAHLSSQGVDTSLELTRRGLSWDEPSAPLLARLGLPSGQARFSGKLVAHAPRGAPAGVGHFQVKLDVDGMVTVPRLAVVPIALSGSHLEAHGELSAGTLASTMRFSKGAATIELAVRIDPTGRTALAGDSGEDEDDDTERTLVVDLNLPALGCAELIAALPSALRPSLEGMQLEGKLAGGLHASLPLANPHGLKLDGSLDNGCRVLGEPPLADASRLRNEAPVLVDARDEHGRPRHVELGPANPGFRRLDQLPAAVVDTFIEAEDGRFFRHHGLDLAQIRRALAYDLEVGAPGRGGSTITQQLAKNLFLSGDRTLGRKLEEVALAWRLEEQLGKRRILELYLNLVELGPGTYGVAEGARRWMHKDVAQLTVDEAAMLAALLPAPRRGLDAAFQQRYAQLRARLPNARPINQGRGVAAVQPSR